MNRGGSAGFNSVYDVLDHIDDHDKSAVERGVMWERAVMFFLRQDSELRRVMSRATLSDAPTNDGMTRTRAVEVALPLAEMAKLQKKQLSIMIENSGFAYLTWLAAWIMIIHIIHVISAIEICHLRAGEVCLCRRMT